MSNTTTQAFVLGVVSGMRTMSGPALVSHKLSQPHTPDLGHLNFMRSPKTATILKVAAAGELVGDKLPNTPARTQPGPVFGRIASGALCGAALGRSARRLGGARPSSLAGALAGALGAVVGTYALYHLRRNLTHEQGLPDLPVALAEDALALLGGAAVLNES